MLEVQIPAEIRGYKSKLIAGLTTRQLIAIGGSLVVSIPIAVFGKEIIPSDILPWFVVISVAPFAAWGFTSYKDMQFEEFAKVFFKFNFLPQRRVYEDRGINYLASVKERLACTDIMRQRIATGELDEEDLFEYENEGDETDGEEG